MHVSFVNQAMHSNFNLPRGIYMANLTRLFIRDLPVFLQFSSLIIFFDLTCFILFYLEYKFDLILRFYACIQWNVNIFTLFSLLQQPMYSTQYILTPKFIFIMLAYKVHSVLLVWSWVWDHSLEQEKCNDGNVLKREWLFSFPLQVSIDYYCFVSMW